MRFFMTYVLWSFSFNYRLTEMDDTRGSGQGSGNDIPHMTELRDIVQILVGAVTAQQQLL